VPAACFRPDVSAHPQITGAFMTPKTACLLAFLAPLTASAHAQQSVPKPTKADAVKLVQIISTNKAKAATYCKLANLGEEMRKAGEARDNSKLQRLGKQADDLAKALGPEFVRLNAGLDQVNPESKEGKELSTELEKLDQFCPQQ
jgi:hypothetical protein